MHHTSSPPEICPFRRMEATRKREEAEIYLEDRRKWVFVAIDPILDHSGRITGVIHIVRDITGRKEAEESLRGANRDIRSSSMSHPMRFSILTARP